VTGDWVFVIGPARTGTTLVAWLLNLHPECICLSDTGIVQCFDQAIHPPEARRGDMCRVRWTTQRQIDAGQDEAIPYRGWPLPLLRHAVNAVDGDELVRRCCGAVRSLYPEVPLFGDKWPGYCFMWRRVLELFPECRIVVTERDFEATVRSLLRQEWAFPALQEPGERRQAIEANARDQLEAVSGCAADVGVRLEDLNADPEGQVERLIQGVGLEWEQYPIERAVHQVRHGKLN
jgi:hypothetical protein